MEMEETTRQTLTETALHVNADICQIQFAF